jgi:hypothetical protein
MNDEVVNAHYDTITVVADELCAVECFFVVGDEPVETPDVWLSAFTDVSSPSSFGGLW